MLQNLKDLQLQYQGFLKTPFLWLGKGVLDLQQFKVEKQKTVSLSTVIKEKLRLGKLVERFVFFEFQQISTIKILAENIQIQQKKITLGELDCMLFQNEKPIHLEIIYKFYLYDNSVGQNEIEHFIGPNRKDSLVKKLKKLKDKQSPLLYSSQCKEYLKTINLKAQEIEQQVYFKAQLFVPFSNQNIVLKGLNPDCIVGFYINKNELKQFKNCKFYVPNKHNWLVEPHKNIEWLTFINFNLKANEYLERQFSPLCWLKHPNGTIDKIFFVWW